MRAHVNHPVGHLAHAEAGSMAELLLLLLTGVWVVGVAVEPVLEKVGDGLGQLAALAGWPLDETRGRRRGGLRRARRGARDRQRGGRRGGGHAGGRGRGCVGIRRTCLATHGKVVGGEGPLSVALGLDGAIGLSGDAGDAAKEMLLLVRGLMLVVVGGGAAEGGMAEGVVVLEWRGGRACEMARGGGRADDAGRPVLVRSGECRRQPGAGRKPGGAVVARKGREAE